MDKETILSEIKRTARENSESALGIARFSKETGIKPTDWQKHWVRWGDAVREAGYKPNKMASRYKDEVIIEKIVSLTRELGHFPVLGELYLKRRADSNFPDLKVFRRFAGGLGAKLAAKVKSFCEANPEYKDVLSLCSRISDAPNFKTAESSAEKEKFGFVYLIKSGRYYKIGRSNAAGRREYELAIQLPERSKLVHQIRTDDPVGFEEYWHKRFADKRKNGEWFELTASDVKDFTRRKFM